MKLFSFLRTVLGLREGKNSKLIAKKRLKQVILHDRADISPQFLRTVRNDVLGAAARHMDINEEESQIHLALDDDNLSLLACIPIVKIQHTIRLPADNNMHGSLK